MQFAGTDERVCELWLTSSDRILESDSTETGPSAHHIHADHPHQSKLIISS